MIGKIAMKKRCNQKQCFGRDYPKMHGYILFFVESALTKYSLCAENQLKLNMQQAFWAFEAKKPIQR